MSKSTEQKAIDFINSKGGQLKKIRKNGGKHFFDMICKNDHAFTKEKHSFIYGNPQYCTYYPCNAGRKTE